MNNLAIVLIIAISLVTVGVNIAKKTIMKSVGEVSVGKASSVSFWLGFFTNPGVLLMLAFNLVTFGVNMWAFSLAGVNDIAVLVWGMTIPSFLLTLFVTNIFLGESVQSSQYLGLGLIIVSMAVSSAGVYYFFR